jgi:hypothetical protein
MDLITYNWTAEYRKRQKKKHEHTISDRNKLLNGELQNFFTDIIVFPLIVKASFTCLRKNCKNTRNIYYESNFMLKKPFNNFLSNQKSLQQIAFFFNLFLAEFLT